MFRVLDDYELEMHLLGVFARAAMYGIDRRSPSHTVRVDPGTGLPISANDLMPRSMAVTGVQLALELLVRPRQLATSLLRRRVSVEESPHEQVMLGAIDQDKWTRQESEWVDALTQQIKLKVHRMAEAGGTFDAHPRLHDGKPLEDSDGLTGGFRITRRGLEEAMRRVRGTKYAQCPRSPEADLSREAWSNAPQWARQGGAY